MILKGAEIEEEVNKEERIDECLDQKFWFKWLHGLL